MFVAAWRQTTPMAASRNATRSNIRVLFHATAVPSATPTREATKLCGWVAGIHLREPHEHEVTVVGSHDLLVDDAGSDPFLPRFFWQVPHDRAHGPTQERARRAGIRTWMIRRGFLPLRRHSHAGEPHAPRGPHRAHDSGQQDERHQDNHDALEQRIRTGPEGGVEQHEADPAYPDENRSGHSPPRPRHRWSALHASPPGISVSPG